MEILKAVFMGIVEGITEWLPISSTGHMILFEQLIHFNMTSEFVSMFRVVIQLGAILAVVAVYFKKLWPFSLNKTTFFLKPPIVILWFKIIVACIPAAVFGLFLDDFLDTYLNNFWVVAAMLILYGGLFFIVDQRRYPKTASINRLSFKDAFIIGLFQVLAMIPGTSRSGATILGGLLIGTTRPVAAEFSFFLAIPVMFGASGLKLFKYFYSGGAFGISEFTVLSAGFITAFLVSILSVKALMRYVKSHSFKAFGWYRIILGIIIIIIGLLNL